MSYREFTWLKAKRDFNLTTREGGSFFPEIPIVQPSSLLQQTLDRGIPWAIAVGNEKARSEAIINPILLEVKQIAEGKISVFSGEEFNVEPEVGLNGTCDFLVSQSPEQLAVEAPVLVVVEAKKEDLKQGMGQCLAEMVAAQRFNQTYQKAIPCIYGSVSTGTTWRFLKLEDSLVTVDLTDYPVPPVETVLSILVWIVESRESIN
ncbi:MAG TPA: hypothetical protein IGS17_13990 [Oscillatoriales cyanobacterium M59_W2019_021]|nr:MAG: hypothetical protein D6728_09355 [Cyanobacteria bacterium J055]HIK32903.1 hypothetical protein [Oscillatoriales cyanobacterium M4454_W2019_049]HIK52014.1 hypothetical protein [Oscillatoriales cyanobacterium M59_W2019_021]